MIQRSLLFLTLIFVAFSCKKSECFTPPKQTAFELVNANGENLIANGTISISDFVIHQDAGNGTLIGINYKVGDDKIVIEELGWFNGSKNYKFFSPMKTFSFSVASSKIDSSGYNSYRIDEVRFIDVSGSKENDFYKIIIE